MSLIEDLKWRYAAKKMNGEQIPEDKLNYILEAARLAPSSSGLQPYKIFVISNKVLLNKIKDVALNSIAPSLIHQESEIIKRTLRDRK